MKYTGWLVMEQYFYINNKYYAICFKYLNVQELHMFILIFFLDFSISFVMSFPLKWMNPCVWYFLLTDNSYIISRTVLLTTRSFIV